MNPWEKWLAQLLPPCEEVSRAMSSGEYERMPLHRRALIRMHLFRCVHCSRYFRELKVLGEGMRLLLEKHLSPSLEKKVKEKLLTPPS